MDWFCEVEVLPVDDVEVLELALTLSNPYLVLLVVVEPLVHEAAGSLQLEAFVDDVVEDVDEGFLGQPIGHLLQLELERREPLGDLGAQRVWLPLVLLEWRHEIVHQPTSTHAYALSEDRSNPSFEMSILFS